MLVSDAAEVDRVARELAEAPLAAFDLEFVSADRLVPELCLVQVAWGVPGQVDPAIALLDPLAADVSPAIRALAAHPCVVLHAGRQDLQLLVQAFGEGASFPGLIDTQVMAAFAGIGDQVGLAPLVGDLLGVALAKEQQWTDWARRPLSPAQLAYAAADVRHLPQLYALLAGRLGGKLAWAKAVSDGVAADGRAAALVTPETAWEQVGGVRGLDGAALGAVRGLAAWRQRVASELGKPLGHVLHDKQLVELARARPGVPDGVRGVRGIAAVARQRAGEVVAAIAESPPLAMTGAAPSRAPSARAQRWAEVLLALVPAVAERHGVAGRLLATRADAESFARAYDEGGDAGVAEEAVMRAWRRDVIGEVWRGFLGGTVAVVGDAESVIGLRIVDAVRGGQDGQGGLDQRVSGS